jgi:arginine decarboxylase
MDSLAACLVASLDRSSRNATASPSHKSQAWSWATVTPVAGCSLREAFFAPSIAVPIEASVGRIVAESVCPYPPGVPLLVPGERITADTLSAIAEATESGARLAYAADPTCATLQVLR